MFKVSSDIYFIVYNLYYIGRNYDLGPRARPIHWDRGSNYVLLLKAMLFSVAPQSSHLQNIIGKRSHAD
jgi:hypothetical protein